MESPNGGLPMAACGWIFGCEMGGEFIYFGRKKDKAQDRRDKILECKGYRRTPGFSLMVWCVFQYTVINY